MGTASWNTGTSGNWSQGANWTPDGVPGAGTDVTISVGGAYDVTVSAPEAAHTLLLDDAGATLQIGSTLSIGSSFVDEQGVVSLSAGDMLALAGSVKLGVADGNDGPTIAGPGTLLTRGIVSLATQSAATFGDHPDLFLIDGGNWINSGTVNVGGLICYGSAASDTATFANLAHAVFNLQDDFAGFSATSPTSGTASFSNAGLLEKTGGTGVSTIAAAIINTGTLAAAKGTLEFTGGGSLGGVLTTSGTGLIAFGAGDYTLSNASVSANLLLAGGTFTIATPTSLAGTLSIAGGDLDIAASMSDSGSFIATFSNDPAQGVISIAAGKSLSLTGLVSFGVANGDNGPVIDGPGTLFTSGVVTLVTQSPATFGDHPDVYLIDGASWINSGTVNAAGVIDFGDSATDSNLVVNQEGAVFNLGDDFAGLSATSNPAGTAAFSNAGLLEKIGGTGMSTIAASITNTATGTLASTSGTLAFTNNGVLNGDLITSGTGILAFGGNYNLSNATVAADLLLSGGTFTIATAVSLSGGLTLADGDLDIAASTSEFGSFTATTSDSPGQGVISIASGKSLLLTGPVSFGEENGDNGPVIEGPGTLSTTGIVTLVTQSAAAFGNHPDLYLIDGASWINSGTVNAAGGISFGTSSSNTASFINQVKGVFNLTDDYAGLTANTNPQGGSAMFSNAGLLEKTGGTGTSTIAATITNIATGTLAASSGTLAFIAGGSLAGALTTTGTGILAFAAGNYTLANATVSADLLLDGGTLTATAPNALAGGLTITTGVLDVAADISESGSFVAISNNNPSQASIELASDKTLTLSGPVSFGVAGTSGPVLQGPGTLMTSGTVTLATQVAPVDGDNPDLYLIDGASWINGGTVIAGGVIQYGITAGDKAKFINLANAVFDLTDDYAGLAPGGGQPVSTASFSNAGLLEKTGGSLASSIDALVSNATTGTLAAASGTLDLAGGLTNLAGSTLSRGSYIAANATLEFSNHAALATIAANVTLIGTASVIESFDSNNNTLTLDTSLDRITAAGGLSVLGGRNFTVVANGGSLINSGLLELGGGTFAATAIALGGSGTIAGYGIVQANETGNGTLCATHGVLDFSSDTIGFLTGTTLTSGNALEADKAATLKLANNQTIIVDSGIITLSGTKSVIESLNVSSGKEIVIESSLDEIAAGGAFNVLAGRGFTATADAGTFTNSGALSLGGGTFKSAVLIDTTGALLTGFGTVAGPIENAGTILAAGGTLALTGTLAGGGVLSAAAGGTVKLSTGGALSEPITGSGTLELSGTTPYSFSGTLTVGSVAIDAGTSLSGQGTLQANLLVNGGTANVATIALSGGRVISGFGIVDGNVIGSGAVRAIGGTLDLTGATLSLLAGTKLAAASALQANEGATLKLANNKTIAVDAGTITLSGKDSVIESLNSLKNTQITIDATLDDIAAGGALNLLSGRNFSAVANAGSFTNAGQLTLGGGSFTSTLLNESAAAGLTGFGMVAGPIKNAGSITAAGGTLSLTGSLSGAGTLSAALGATLKLNLGGALSEAVTGAGTLELSGATAYGLAGSLAIAGVQLDAGSALSGTGTLLGNIADAGSVTASGGTLVIGGSVSGAGTLSAQSGAVLELEAGGIVTGALTGAGKIQIDGALTLNGGASLAAASLLENANLNLGSGVSITNQAGDVYTIAAADTVKLGGSGSFTNAGTLNKTGAGEGVIGTTFINAAAVAIGSGEMLFQKTVTGTGTIGISSGATAEFLTGAAASQTLNFLSSTGTLGLGSPASFLGSIAGFTGSDVINLLNTAASSLNYANGKLTVFNGTKTVATLAFSGNYATGNFVLNADSHDGSLITWKA